MSGASISEMCLTAVVCVFLACSVADCNASKDARARVRAPQSRCVQGVRAMSAGLTLAITVAALTALMLARVAAQAGGM
jgi:predicted LPLAT superfamily acyltransferase